MPHIDGKLSLKVPGHIASTSWTHDFFPLFIYNAIRYNKPNVCVELGTLEGYSAYCIAQGLVDNMKGHLECYDLWDDYEYKHCTRKLCAQNLAGMPVILRQKDAMIVHEDYEDGTVDFLMVDISNDGDKYKSILMNWHDKLTSRATVMLEGGCQDRDKVDWMVKYNKTPIHPIFHDQDIIDRYSLTNLGCFPSITVALKKA